MENSNDSAIPFCSVAFEALIYYADEESDDHICILRGQGPGLVNVLVAQNNHTLNYPNSANHPTLPVHVPCMPAKVHHPCTGHPSAAKSEDSSRCLPQRAVSHFAVKGSPSSRNPLTSPSTSRALQSRCSAAHRRPLPPGRCSGR